MEGERGGIGWNGRGKEKGREESGCMEGEEGMERRKEYNLLTKHLGQFSLY